MSACRACPLHPTPPPPPAADASCWPATRCSGCSGAPSPRWRACACRCGAGYPSPAASSRASWQQQLHAASLCCCLARVLLRIFISRRRCGKCDPPQSPGRECLQPNVSSWAPPSAPGACSAPTCGSWTCRSATPSRTPCLTAWGRDRAPPRATWPPATASRLVRGQLPVLPLQTAATGGHARSADCRRSGRSRHLQPAACRASAASGVCLPHHATTYLHPAYLHSSHA